MEFAPGTAGATTGPTTSSPACWCAPSPVTLAHELHSRILRPSGCGTLTSLLTATRRCVVRTPWVPPGGRATVRREEQNPYAWAEGGWCRRRTTSSPPATPAPIPPQRRPPPASPPPPFATQLPNGVTIWGKSGPSPATLCGLRHPGPEPDADLLDDADVTRCRGRPPRTGRRPPPSIGLVPPFWPRPASTCSRYGSWALATAHSPPPRLLSMLRGCPAPMRLPHLRSSNTTRQRGT